MFSTDFARALPQHRNIELFETIKAILHIKKDINDFIGSHPVNLSKENIFYILENDYFVCEKTDGIRLMLFIFESIVYLYDRKNKFYQTDLVFNTDHIFLFDGEMYQESQNYIFAIFDTLIYDSKQKTDLNLNKRLGYCFEFEKIIQKGFIKRRNNSQLMNFFIIPKHMFKSYAFPLVLESIKTLKHENDGLIFTPVNEPYEVCSRSKILKWKPPHLNTVDFLIKRTEHPGIFELLCNISTDQLNMLNCNRNGCDTRVVFGHLFVNQNDDTINEDIDNRIGEFSYKNEEYSINLDDLTVKEGGWYMHRIRTDKDSPNNIKVVLDTMDSIRESVKEDDLKEYLQEIKDNYKERELKGIS